MIKEKVVEALEKVIAAIKEEPAPVVAESGRFKKLSNGWVLDKALNIEWGPSSQKGMDWEDAKKYATAEGGCLPTIQELRSLVDYEKYNPAIDRMFFPDTKTDDSYWTGTICVGDSGSAWFVDFQTGDTNIYSREYSNYVRPVRSSP